MQARKAIPSLSPREQILVPMHDDLGFIPKQAKV